MKTNPASRFLFFMLLFETACFSPLLFAQGTAFTYQGRLNDGGAPANGLYDLRFKLFVDPLGNTQAGGAVLTNGVPVAGGLFTVTLDFGPGLFTGSNYWLEVDVKTNDASSYVDLSPLQALTPVPYAVYAENAVSGGLAAGIYTNSVTLNNPANSFSGSFIGDGASVSNVNALTLNGMGAGAFWQLGGNAVAGGQFLGSTNNQPVDLWVNGARGWRLDPGNNTNSVVGAPNVIGGAPINFVDGNIYGATIAGGGAVNMTGFLPGPSSNHVSAIFGAIGGGRLNTVGADHGTIAGGLNNTIQTFAYDSVIGGGYGHLISSNSTGAVIGGGHDNTVGIASYEATVGGGFFNTVGGNSYQATIGGGYFNSATAPYTTVGGGYNNHATFTSATVGGGYQNTATNDSATVSGGVYNQATGPGAVVGGGIQNIASAYAATVSGGKSNNAASTYAVVAGGTNNLASGDGSIVNGGYNNTASAPHATVSGGTNNVAGGDGSTVGGGYNNSATNAYATTSGGYGNLASGVAATVPGGVQNIAAGLDSFAAGTGAQALHNYAFVWSDGSQAFSSSAPNQFAVQASGGVLLAADVQLSGGAAYHNLSLSGGNALGYLYGSYPALGDGIHLGYNYYYDAAGGGHVSNAGGATSRLSVQYGQIDLAVGGVGSAPTADRLIANSSGVTVYGTFNNSSDRNAKQDFAPVSPAEILDKVAHLPISEWSYKTDPKTRHIGPMAQDFYPAFSLGTDDKHIAPMDEGGVALAAIQGLNQKLEHRSQRSEVSIQQLEAENAELKQRNDSLEKRLDALEKIILSQRPN